ncbi:hypothetical protein AU511_12895 [Lonsdalea iberica]|uniref:Uncharacterized protein n=1 Tax=Lonsdalea iberica TaxID=1082703 RepID=A0A1X3RR42_9GAMM|nr:hypothetical protein AU511_12895 [Lonsdalea iberica]
MAKGIACGEIFIEPMRERLRCFFFFYQRAVVITATLIFKKHALILFFKYFAVSFICIFKCYFL